MEVGCYVFKGNERLWSFCCLNVFLFVIFIKLLWFGFNGKWCGFRNSDFVFFCIFRNFLLVNFKGNI